MNLRPHNSAKEIGAGSGSPKWDIWLESCGTPVYYLIVLILDRVSVSHNGMFHNI